MIAQVSIDITPTMAAKVLAAEAKRKARLPILAKTHAMAMDMKRYDLAAKLEGEL